MPVARNLKVLFVCLLAASWLCMGNAVEAKVGDILPQVKDAAPGKDPKNRLHLPGEPCPDNINVDTWEQSSSFWRYTYELCKPKGAPAGHATNWEDLEHFIRESSFIRGDKREHKIVREQWTVKRCLVSVLYDHDPIDVEEAERRACNIVEQLIRYFKTNGRDPLKERMTLIVRIYNKGCETERMFAFLDHNMPESEVRFVEFREGKLVPVQVD